MGTLSEKVRLRAGMASSRALAFLDGVYEKNAKGLTAATGVSMAVNMMFMNAFATDIFTKAKGMMNTIYSSIAAISSVTAGCVAAVCLYLMFFSKNQNTVQESIQWLKRIFVCWVAIMLMSTIIYFVTSNLGIGDSASLT
ncbi:MAG: hypothetical protein LUE14_05310 [Clostridiales bacterium]|nr:hypothetical protein [Clostridiales bacterium]